MISLDFNFVQFIGCCFFLKCNFAVQLSPEVVINKGMGGFNLYVNGAMIFFFISEKRIHLFPVKYIKFP